jgi:hypothetical protein
MSFRSSIFSFSTGIALALVPAYSTTITTYSNPASWQAATTPGYQTVTFEGLTPPGTGTAYTGPTGVTASGTEFIGVTSTGASSITVVDTSAVTWYNFGTGDALQLTTDRQNSSSPLPYINIVLPANVTALSTNLYTTSPNALSYTITVAGNQYTVPTFSQPTLAFWGLTSDTPISSLQLALQGTTFNGSSQEFIDNFSLGASDLTAAPEAGTYLMIGTGLIGLVALRKRLMPMKNLMPEKTRER